MSPDLEWRVDDQSEKQTIARTTSPRPPRWRGIMIGIVVCLGIGLGVVYMSLPESPKVIPMPTLKPSPAPPAIPAALYQTIVREATALQTGNSSELIDLLDAEDQQYQPYRSGSGNFQRWGTPRTGRLFTVGDVGFLADERAWVDVSQYREGRTFHETRFYRLLNGQWKRTKPDAALWSGQPDYVDTLHFRIVYWPFDQKIVPAIAAQLERDYEHLCTDLECDLGTRQCVTALDQDWCSAFTTSPTITLQLRGNDSAQITVNAADQHAIIQLSLPRVAGSYDNANPLPYSRSPAADQHAIIQLSSPRVAGFYDNANPLPYSRSPAAAVISNLLVQQAAYGRVSSSEPSQNGEVLIATIGGYALARLQSSVAGTPIEDYLTSLNLNINNPPPLASLWEKLDSTNADQMYAEASALIRYIEQTHGWLTVVKLLKSIKQADSMSKLIELSLDLPLADFEQNWRAWLKSNVP